MPRIIQTIIGPELLWCIFYLAASLLARANVPASKALDNTLVNLAYIVPLVAVPLTFSLFFWPGIEKNWLLLRINIACLLGTHYVLSKGLGAHSEQGPGIGTAYMMGMAFGLVVQIILTIVLKIRTLF